MKGETDIITSIAVSLIGRVVILVIIHVYVKTFRTDVTVILCLTSH